MRRGGGDTDPGRDSGPHCSFKGCCHMHPGKTEATRAGPAEGMPEVRGRAGVGLRMPSRPRLMASPCQLYELCPSLISPESPRPTRNTRRRFSLSMERNSAGWYHHIWEMTSNHQETPGAPPGLLPFTFTPQISSRTQRTVYLIVYRILLCARSPMRILRPKRLRKYK